MAKINPKTKNPLPAPQEKKVFVEPVDEVADALVAKGLAHNHCLLDINKTLTVPPDINLDYPWNLPSRMFQFPLRVIADPDGVRRIFLAHPLLADHPFVQRVAGLGFTIETKGFLNQASVPISSDPYQWHHAVDLACAGKWTELLDTQRFTTKKFMFDALSFVLCYTKLNGKPITTKEARRIMKALQAGPQPQLQEAIFLFAEPRPCRQDSGKVIYPINVKYGNRTTEENDDDQACQRFAEQVCWAYIVAIEAGWFSVQGNHLFWSEAGMNHYQNLISHKNQNSATKTTQMSANLEEKAAPAIVVEKNGQAAFLF